MKHILFAILAATLSTPIYGQSISVYGGDHANALSITSPTTHSLNVLNVPLTVQWEGGVVKWNVEQEAAIQLYATPKLTWQATDNIGVSVGVGVSYFNKTKFGTRDITTMWQFADHLDLSYKQPQGYTVGVRIGHASNGGVRKPNPGMNGVFLYLSMPL